MSVRHVHLHRVRGGLITEHLGVRDDLELSRQLGLVEHPPLAPPEDRP